MGAIGTGRGHVTLSQSLSHSRLCVCGLGVCSQVAIGFPVLSTDCYYRYDSTDDKGDYPGEMARLGAVNLGAGRTGTAVAVSAGHSNPVVT